MKYPFINTKIQHGFLKYHQLSQFYIVSESFCRSNLHVFHANSCENTIQIIMLVKTITIVSTITIIAQPYTKIPRYCPALIHTVHTDTHIRIHMHTIDTYTHAVAHAG